MNKKIQIGDTIKVKGHDGKWIQFNNTKCLFIKEVYKENEEITGVAVRGSDEPIDLRYREWKTCVMENSQTENNLNTVKKALKSKLWKETVLTCLKNGKSTNLAIETADLIVDEFEMRF